jgi:hypothetical protein
MHCQKCGLLIHTSQPVALHAEADTCADEQMNLILHEIQRLDYGGDTDFTISGDFTCIPWGNEDTMRKLLKKHTVVFLYEKHGWVEMQWRGLVFALNPSSDRKKVGVDLVIHGKVLKLMKSALENLVHTREKIMFLPKEYEEIPWKSQRKMMLILNSIPDCKLLDFCPDRSSSIHKCIRLNISYKVLKVDILCSWHANQMTGITMEICP